MSGQTAISIRNISKKYRLFSSAKERLVEALHPFKKKYHREFWALKGINFDIERGSTVGIIGRNGSGKSTLLQIICAVLQPSEGMVKVSGRVSALLELGAGFNPLLTGRQNVAFNGAVTGFSKQEMGRRMALIKDFADIGDFFDQPVKTYSSGMYVRLAFAAAINVDPDILVVDEALAVGDAKFQHKCFSKFREFQNSGKTILFVSHSTDAVIKHCDRAILLENGVFLKSGEPGEVVNCYLDVIEGRHASQGIAPPNAAASTGDGAPGLVCRAKQPAAVQSDEIERFIAAVPAGDNCVNRKSYNKNEYPQGSPRCEIVDYLVVTGGTCDAATVLSGDRVDIYLKVRFHDAVESPEFGFTVNTVDGASLYALNTFYRDAVIAPVFAGDVIVFRFSVRLGLATGDYFIDLGVDEKIDDRGYRSLVRRRAVCHLFVQKRQRFDGVVDLDAAFDEVSRRTAARDSSGMPGGVLAV